MSNFYDILGVSKQASDKELKQAYKKASMQHHPDRGGDEDTFKKINEAYSTLKDPNKRQAYDNPQPQGFNFNSQDFQNSNPFAGTPFADMFAGGSPFGQQRRQPRNQDMRIQVNINLKEAMNGKTVIAQMQMGSGRVETLNIDIPPGAKDGDQIQYEGLGDDRHTQLPRGNLHVQIICQGINGWERKGNHLYTKKVVNLFDLLLGCVIIVHTLDNKNVKVTLPQGTNPGQTFSIPDYGFPDVNTRRRGNLYVIIDAETPKIENESLLNKIQQLKEEIK